jgi:carbonic anhydrase
MRLLEAIIEANHRALAGDEHAGLHPAEFAGSLPIIALTCIDPRLNPLMPEVLGIPEAQFIWLRNAGNIITGPLSSTMRSLALACAVKGGREIVIIGHTDCLVGKTSMMELMERFKALGVDRTRLPENLTEYLGLFASERQNVLKAVEFVRASPLIGPGVPVHGLLVDIGSGRLEWLVDGYQGLGTASSTPASASADPGAPPLDAMRQMLPFNLGEMKFPAGKIGDLAAAAEGVMGRVEHAATRAEHLAGKAGEFAEKVGNLADQATNWLKDVQIHGHQADPPPAVKVQTPKPKPYKPIPVPPPIPGPTRPARGRKPLS